MTENHAFEVHKPEGSPASMDITDSYNSDLYTKTMHEKFLNVRPSSSEEQFVSRRRRLPSYTAPESVYEDIVRDEDEDNDVFDSYRHKAIAEKEDEYHARIRNVFAEKEARGFGPQDYKKSVEEVLLDNEQRRLEMELSKKVENELLNNSNEKKRSRWDLEGAVVRPASEDDTKLSKTEFSTSDSTLSLPSSDSNVKSTSRWDQTPVVQSQTARVSRWDQKASTNDIEAANTNAHMDDNAVSATTGSDLYNSRNSTGTGEWGQADASNDQSKKRISRWDQTPTVNSGMVGNANISSSYQATPLLVQGLTTPLINVNMASPQVIQAVFRDSEVARLNRFLSDAELDKLLPGEAEDFIILPPPPGYVPTRVRTPYTPSFSIPTTFSYGVGLEEVGIGPPIELGDGLPDLRPGDKPYFEPLLEVKDESKLTPEESKEIHLLKLLLKVKNGLPIQRKQALRQIADKAREFGPSLLFDKILPILMSKTLEEQERHLLVKVIDRVMYRLEDLIRPHVKDLLLVIQPLLVDEDYYTRIEGREIISNLAKAAGLHTMIKEMRPSIDNKEELVRNTCARAFAVVAAALGPQQVMLFLKAVCKSKKSWMARHTGIKIVQQMAMHLGCAILPHLGSLVDIIAHGLTDESSKVQHITAMAFAALAEASAPYGIEKFEKVLTPLLKGLKLHSGRTLGAFIRAVGFLIPLMDSRHANYYSKELMNVLLKQFREAGQEETRRTVLQVLRQCVKTEGVDINFVRNEVLNPFFDNFWIIRIAADKRFYREVIETTVTLSLRIGGAEVISKLTVALRSEADEFRKMAAETIDKILQQMGLEDLSEIQIQKLVDALVYAFKIQTGDTSPEVLNTLSTLIIKLGTRAKPYLLPIKQDVLEPRMTFRIPAVRQITCDLLAKIAPVMKLCDEEKMMSELGQRLFENLGEEYPDVLGSMLAALRSIVNVIGMNRMTPSISELLPRLTPILKNRKEKVQENCIDLVGRIADRGKDYVSPKEWMRICFELLEMLKAHKKGIRRAAVATFGYIAAAVGPSQVLAALLNNLRVQERQNRVCTTVAIAIVAETCQPFTVLPLLMNEYRVPELNIQNGVLKALSFLFEYISEMGKDYIYAVTPLLEDALMDRDSVHRQTACSVVKHMSLGVTGLSVEDALIHLLNYVWPNVFETSPHVINAVFEAIDGLRVALGAPIIFQYLVQGLFHPARKVRQTYWKLYNNIYIGAVDSLIPMFPDLPSDEKNSYIRPELELHI